ncbi:MAG: ABC transporter ATP-binding protein [Xanthomonadales bacterium]|nr:ABC transporter ATP-binding protein [Gammaproteobacteria bacterium]MBT8055107.1 ABC transporter ATP-binding protein [Gammaproteobacteria bacterium]NND58404.1 ABC transporter ATP-binding protein [Xanthomonadales bacterium]NNK51701.1 ABC transporter ATP-binding protein [Xanthomonadales bacterium]
MSVLACKQVDVRIAGIQVANKLDLEIRQGQFWGLLGPNGIGKTTLLKCLSGLDHAAGGKVLLENKDINQLPRKLLARHIGMLQQHTVYVFDSSVLQTALTGRHPHLAYWEREGATDLGKARDALESVGLEGFEARSVTGLSGGEARRLAFAALLVQEPGIMLLDEPTNHLDLKHQVEIMRMIEQRTRGGSSSAFAALHDINLAARYCSHVVMLFGEGAWCAGPTAEMLNETSLERLYNCPVERLESASGPRFHPKAD